MRFGELDRDTLNPQQQSTYDRIADGPRGAVRGPFVAWIRSPEFADRAEALGNYLRFESTLPLRAKELAVLMVARSWRAAFVWKAHAPLAVDAGIPEDAVEAIRLGKPPQFDDELDRVAYSFLAELIDDRRISDQAWHAAIRQLGDKGVVDLLGITGYYCMVASTVVGVELGTGGLDTFFNSAGEDCAYKDFDAD
ncbi:MAG: carboxymuconolactone decarboxylase family protein [Rhizobiaceae bacterium]|nr:carboxymuconolactone decarboxylase family protein [Rhizobiaceae bacterium]